MSSSHQMARDPESQYAGILERNLHAYTLAEEAASRLAEALAGHDEAALSLVAKCEEELDRIDREIDSCVTAAIAEVSEKEARELLTAMKTTIDLERIGDLLSSVASCTRALGQRIETDDVGDLIRMATSVERMLRDAHGAFVVRNLDRALAIFQADSEVDRLRNLMMFRHLEQAQIRFGQDSVHVLFMAQALERAGDHVKNIAEELCHLITGRPMRHLLPRLERPQEQMYLQWLRTRHLATIVPTPPSAGTVKDSD